MAPPRMAGARSTGAALKATAPRSCCHTSPVSTTASAPNVIQPTAALKPSATIAVAASPLTMMPKPGPTKIRPASLGAPRAASRAIHQPEV